jgi:hypothetical protein
MELIDLREVKLPKWAQNEIKRLRQEISRRDADIKSLTGQRLPARVVRRGLLDEPYIPVSSTRETLLWNLDGEWDERDMSPDSFISIGQGILALSTVHRFDRNLLQIRSNEGGIRVHPSSDNGVLIGIEDW